MPRRLRVLAVAGLLAVTCGAYARALSAGFVFDDAHVLVENQALHDLRHVGRYFTDPTTGSSKPELTFFRPLRSAVHAFAYHLWGANPGPFHALNLALHLTNVLLVLALVRGLGSSFAVAWVVAAIFALHPLQTEAVTNITGLADVLFAFGFLLALVLHARLLESDRADPLLAAGVYLAFGAALLAKEMAVTLPLLVVVRDGLLGRERRNRWRMSRYLAYSGGLFAVALGFVVLRAHVLGVSGMGAPYEGGTLGRTMAMQAWVLTKYLQLFLVPVGQTVRHVIEIPESFASARVVFPIAMVLALTVVGGWSLRRNRRVAFGLAWCAITFLPVMNVVPLRGSMMGERFCYVPLVGAAYAIVWLAANLAAGAGGTPLRRRVGEALVIAVVLVLACLTVRRNGAWQSNLTIFEAAVEVSPRSNVVRIGLAQEYEQRGRVADARAQQLAGLVNMDYYRRLYTRLGDAAFARGHAAAAREWYARILKMYPDDPHARMRTWQLDEGTGR